MSIVCLRHSVSVFYYSSPSRLMEEVRTQWDRAGVTRLGRPFQARVVYTGHLTAQPQSLLLQSPFATNTVVILVLINKHTEDTHQSMWPTTVLLTIDNGLQECLQHAVAQGCPSSVCLHIRATRHHLSLGPCLLDDSIN